MDENTKQEFEDDIKNIREEYSKAKKVLTSIEEYAEKFVKFREILDNPDDGIEVNYEWIKKKRDQIDGFHTESNNFLENIKNNLVKVNQNIGEMENSYLSFTELKGKITGRSTEIENLLSQVTSLKNDIERIKNESQGLLDKINSIFSDFESKIEDMKQAYQEFVNIKNQIEDEENGLEAIFEYAKGMKDDSSALITEIRKHRDEATMIIKEIKLNKTTSDDLKIEIQKNLDSANEKKIELEKVVGLITDTAFHERLEQRKKEIKEDLDKKLSWKNILWISLVLLGIIVVFLQTPWSGVKTDNIFETFFFRIVLTSPILGLIVFSAIQYSKERDLLEKYAFKSSASVILRHHIDYLLETEKIDKDKISDFSIKTFSMIYKPPYKETDSSLEERLKNIENKLMEDKKEDILNIKEVIENIKELKELIPDDTVLSKIVGFFIKK